MSEIKLYVHSWTGENISDMLKLADVEVSSEKTITISVNEFANVIMRITSLYDVMLRERDGKNLMMIDTHGKHFSVR